MGLVLNIEKIVIRNILDEQNTNINKFKNGNKQFIDSTNRNYTLVHVHKNLRLIRLLLTKPEIIYILMNELIIYYINDAVSKVTKLLCLFVWITNCNSKCLNRLYRIETCKTYIIYKTYIETLVWTKISLNF